MRHLETKHLIHKYPFAHSPDICRTGWHLRPEYIKIQTVAPSQDHRYDPKYTMTLTLASPMRPVRYGQLKLQVPRRACLKYGH